MSEQSELVPVERQPLQVQSASALPTINVEALLEKAIDAKSAVEVVKELRQMAMEDLAFKARRAFDAAMKSFRAEVPFVIKTIGVRDNAGTEAYKFAPIEQIEAHIKPFCDKYGFSHRFPKMTVGEGLITVFCEVRHEAGHAETTEASYRVGTKTRMMSDTQVDAATESFAKRRALSNAYGLVMAGEDRLELHTQGKPAGPSRVAGDTKVKALAQELWNLLTPVRGTAKNWEQANQWLWREEILDAAADEKCPHLSPERFRVVIDAAKKRLP